MESDDPPADLERPVDSTPAESAESDPALDPDPNPTIPEESHEDAEPNARGEPNVAVSVESDDVGEENAEINDAVREPSINDKEDSEMDVDLELVPEAPQPDLAALRLQEAEAELNKQREYAERFRLLRDSAVDERNSLMDVIRRLNAELERQKVVQSKNLSMLNDTIKTNTDIVTKHGELKTKEFSLKCKEEVMDHEKRFLNEKIESLTAELVKTSVELETVQINTSSKIYNLEIELNAKSLELEIADADVVELRAERLKSVQEIETLTQRLDEQMEAQNKTIAELQKKLNAKTRVVEIYKSMKDDNNLKCEELSAGVTELQKMLKDSYNKCVDLEAEKIQIELKHEATVDEKNEAIDASTKQIEDLKNELKQIKIDRTMAGITYLSPTAFTAREFIKCDKSLAEIYNEFVQVKEELSKKTEENAQLKEAFETVLHELKENAPLVRKHLSQYEDIVDNNSVIVQELESTKNEFEQLKEDYAESVKMNSHHEREKKKLREELNDLAQQVCFLLREMDISRGHDRSKNSLHNSTGAMSSSVLISNNLVEFSNIQELQSNNQKLLAIVRELTQRQEEMESLKEQIETGELQKKMEIMYNKVTELQNSKERQTKQVNELIEQRDMYKKLYHDNMNADSSKVNLDMSRNQENTMKNKDDKSDIIKLLETQLRDLKQQLDQKEKDHVQSEEHFEKKEKKLLSQIESFRKDLHEINETHTKTSSDLEAYKEKLKFLNGDLVTHKKKVEMLEAKNENLYSKIGEQETTIKFLRDTISREGAKASKTDFVIKNLQEECQSMRTMRDALILEKKRLHEELEVHSTLASNLDIIKSMVDKKAKDKIRYENKLQEISKEFSLLQAVIQEKKSIFGDTSVFASQTSGDQTELQQLTMELARVKRELAEKIKLIEDLNNQDTRDVDYGFQVDLLNEQINDFKNENKTLQERLLTVESKFLSLKSDFGEYKNKTESEIGHYRKSSEELKQKCATLEEELSLISDNNDEINKDLKIELTQSRERIDSLMVEIQSKNALIDSKDVEITQLSNKLLLSTEENNAKNVSYEENLANVRSLNKEIDHLRNEIIYLRHTNVDNEKRLDESKKQFESYKEAMKDEKEESLSNIKDLQQQNNLLLNQIEALTPHTLISQNSSNAEVTNDSSFNESYMNISSEENLKSFSKLMQIIQYLRKERDSLYTKFNTMQEENLQIKANLEMLEKTRIRNVDSNINDVNLVKHSEIMKKLDMFNTISQSNNLLREERDNLLSRVNDSLSNTMKLEETISSLQDSNSELTKKINNIMIENSCVIAECGRWKTRFNSLSEKTNKTNLEEWKRLQNERETLAKMLSAEKEQFKKVKDEALINKLEKSKLEEQNSSLNKRLTNLLDDVKKHTAEVANLKKELNQVSSELTTTKSKLTEKEEEIVRLNDDITNEISNTKDSHNKEMQLRKLARKYKMQYEELLKSTEDNKEKSSEMTSNEDDVHENDQKLTDKEKAYSEKIVELESQISSTLDERDVLQKEIFDIRNKNQDMEEKAKQRLIEAKNKIIVLNDLKENLTKRLTEANAKIDMFEQSKDEHDDRLAALKSQYDGRLAKLEKEKVQMQLDQQVEVSQLQRQIEMLTQKMATMQKQIDLQPSKSGNISVQVDKPSVDPPTANIKPMAGNPQPIGARRAGGDTPLASIRPMTSVSGVRTAAVLPNAQYSTAAPIHVHALHSTASGDVISSVPSSSHTIEYLPSSSMSNRHAVVHSPYSALVSEAIQDMDSDAVEKTDCSNVSLVAPSTTQQAVALVLPRMETTIDSSVSHQQSVFANTGSNSGVTTSQNNMNIEAVEDRSCTSGVQKRPLPEVEQDKSAHKKQKTETVNTTVYETEYQVPTSSQKDQECDNVIVVDSDDEEEGNEFEESYEEKEEEMEEEEEEDDDSDVEEESIDEDEDLNKDDNDSEEGHDSEGSNEILEEEERIDEENNIEEREVESNVEEEESGEDINESKVESDYGKSDSDDNDEKDDLSINIPNNGIVQSHTSQLDDEQGEENQNLEDIQEQPEPDEEEVKLIPK